MCLTPGRPLMPFLTRNRRKKFRHRSQWHFDPSRHGRNISEAELITGCEKRVQGQKMCATLTKSGRRSGNHQAGAKEDGVAQGINSGRDTMVEVLFKARVRGRIRAVWLGLTISVIVAVQLAHAQSSASFSAQTGQPNLTALPGQNVAQQTMSGSINNFCPTVVGTAATQNQIDLKTICSAMIGNALQLQGQSFEGLGSYGLNANGLKGALQSLNGGAELLIPTSQASVAQTTQTSRQTGAIEARLKELRGWTTGTVVASTEPLRAGQVATLGSLEPGGQILIAQNQAPPFAYSIGALGVFATGLGQFGSRDMTTSENGYSFNNAGFVAGADYRITPQLIAGLAFGYTQSNTNFDTSTLSASGQSLNGNLLQGK